MTERQKTRLLIVAIILLILAIIAAVYGFGWQAGAAMGAAVGVRLAAKNVEASGKADLALKETTDALRELAATTTKTEEQRRLVEVEIDEMSVDEKIALAKRVLKPETEESK